MNADATFLVQKVNQSRIQPTIDQLCRLNGVFQTANTYAPLDPAGEATMRSFHHHKRDIHENLLAAVPNKDFHGVDFSGAVLSGINLSGANLSYAKFCGTDLQGANLKNTIVSQSDFSHALLTGIDLSSANLSRAKFYKADLQGANLKNTIVSQSDFTEANLVNAILEDKDFKNFASKWELDTKYCSLVSEMVLHPDYQRIIDMGYYAVPLILRQLAIEPDHWFYALQTITGEDPIPKSSKGKLAEMANAWIQWGKEHNYV